MLFVSVSTLQPVLSPKDSVSDIFQRNCGSDSRLDASELQLFLGAVSLEGASFAVTLWGVATLPWALWGVATLPLSLIHI